MSINECKGYISVWKSLAILTDDTQLQWRYGWNEKSVSAILFYVILG